ncbi:ABC transporter substrate-binding protein [Sporomusa aerivorans]|uniref:ABC transporter substrate-binding protein n=1 Tax=Sporomusa aerivorans TaxID=204936 RepID=UPI00352A28D1
MLRGKAIFIISLFAIAAAIIFWLLYHKGQALWPAAQSLTKTAATLTTGGPPVKPAMKRVRTAQGEIEIPVEPKRIVALYYLGHLLTLGVTPVGASQAELEYTFLKEKVAGIANVGQSLEKIAALEPDLIIAIDRQNYEQLAKIAPTVVIPWDHKDVYEELRELAALLNKNQAAETWITAFEIKAERARQKLAGAIAASETVGIYEIWGKGVWLINIDYGRGARNLYKTFQLKPPETAAKYIIAKGDGINLSLETLPQYAADHMFVLVSPAQGGQKQAGEIMESDIWRNLPAAKNNHIYEIDRKEFWPNDPISLENQLDIQLEMLLSRNKK